jgi:hypothetical protein
MSWLAFRFRYVGDRKPDWWHTDVKVKVDTNKRSEECYYSKGH